MKLHDAFKQADEVVLHIGGVALDTDNFLDRDKFSMDEGVPPEFDIYFDSAVGERYFVNSLVEVTLNDEGMTEVTVATAPNGDLLQVKLEFIQRVPLNPFEGSVPQVRTQVHCTGHVDYAPESKIPAQTLPVPGSTWRGINWRVTYDPTRSATKPWEAYWAGSHPPSGFGEDLLPFATVTKAKTWLKEKGAKAEELKILPAEPALQTHFTLDSMNHPATWTADKRPTAANVVNACRWLAEDIHSRVAVQPEHVVAALCEAADLIQGSAAAPEVAARAPHTQDLDALRAALAQAEGFSARQSQRIAAQRRENDILVTDLAQWKQRHRKVVEELEAATRESSQARGELAQANDTVTNLTKERDRAIERARAAEAALSVAQINNRTLEGELRSTWEELRILRTNWEELCILRTNQQALVAERDGLLRDGNPLIISLRKEWDQLKQDLAEAKGTITELRGRMAADLVAEKAPAANPFQPTLDLMAQAEARDNATAAKRYNRLRQEWVILCRDGGDTQVRLTALDDTVDCLFIQAID